MILRRAAHRLMRPLLEARRKPGAHEVTLANTREAYDTVYGTDSLLKAYLEPSRLEFYEIVANACLEVAPRSLIDVGCGSGNLLAALDRKLGLACRLVGFDYSAAGIERARELVPRAELTVAAIGSFPADQHFDVVLCTEVLEHLDDPQPALRLLSALKAEGGRIVITVPDGAIDDFAGHVHFWSEDTFRVLLEPFGRVEIRRIQQVTLLALLD